MVPTSGSHARRTLPVIKLRAHLVRGTRAVAAGFGLITLLLVGAADARVACMASPALTELHVVTVAMTASADEAAVSRYLTAFRRSEQRLRDLARAGPASGPAAVLGRYADLQREIAGLVAAGDAEAARRFLGRDDVRALLAAAGGVLAATACPSDDEAAATAGGWAAATPRAEAAQEGPRALVTRHGELTSRLLYGALACLMTGCCAVILRRMTRTGHDCRGEPRFPCDVESFVICRGQVMPARLCDISRNGAKVEVTGGVLAEREDAQLGLPGALQAATVVWRTSYYAGLKFAGPIPDEVLEAAVAAGTVERPAAVAMRRPISRPPAPAGADTTLSRR